MVRHFQITGTGQLLELSRQLRRAGHENIRQSYLRRIRRAAEPLRADLQSTITGLNIRSEGRKANRQGVTPRGGPSPTTRPFRASIARAVRLSVRTAGTPGARVWIDRSLLPPDITLGAVNQLNDGRLRHPVFNNRKRWANQWTTASWWDKTVRNHTDRITREVSRVADDVRRQLE